MDMFKKVPVREQDPKVEQQILKKFVMDIIKKKRYRKHRDVSDVKMQNVSKDVRYRSIFRHLFRK